MAKSALVRNPAKPLPTGLVSVEEWAKKYGISPITVRRWGQAGKIELYSIPGYGLKRFVEAAKLDALMKPAKVVPTALKRKLRAATPAADDLAG